MSRRTRMWGREIVLFFQTKPSFRLVYIYIVIYKIYITMYTYIHHMHIFHEFSIFPSDPRFQTCRMQQPPRSWQVQGDSIEAQQQRGHGEFQGLFETGTDTLDLGGSGSWCLMLDQKWRVDVDVRGCWLMLLGMVSTGLKKQLVLRSFSETWWKPNGQGFHVPSLRHDTILQLVRMNQDVWLCGFLELPAQGIHCRCVLSWDRP